MGVNYPVLLGTDQVSDDFGDVRQLPTTFYIDRNGNIVGKAVGLLGRKEIEDDVKKALEAYKPEAAQANRASSGGHDPSVKAARVITKAAGLSDWPCFSFDGLYVAQAPGEKQPSVIMAPVGNVQLRPAAAPISPSTFASTPIFISTPTSRGPIT